MKYGAMIQWLTDGQVKSCIFLCECAVYVQSINILSSSSVWIWYYFKEEDRHLPNTILVHEWIFSDCRVIVQSSLKVLDAAIDHIHVPGVSSYRHCHTLALDFNKWNDDVSSSYKWCIVKLASCFLFDLLFSFTLFYFKCCCSLINRSTYDIITEKWLCQRDLFFNVVFSSFFCLIHTARSFLFIVCRIVAYFGIIF